MSFLLLGFFTGLSLILAIGAQNIFVIEQCLKKQYIFLVCLICSLSDLILIFLGFGWNFLFISGTSLVVLTYKEEEKFKAQGINDLIVFTIMALASLSAGILLSLTSWKTMNLICIPFLVLIVYSTFRADVVSEVKKI